MPDKPKYERGFYLVEREDDRFQTRYSIEFCEVDFRGRNEWYVIGDEREDPEPCGKIIAGPFTDKHIYVALSSLR